MADGEVIIDINGDSKKLEKEINSVSGKVKSGFSKIGSIASTALVGVTAAIGTVSTSLAGLGVASVNSYADLEQNLGGIETLFKGSADKVIKNAENAYKTAGMSANSYMQNVTSFSASLLQSLGGDTVINGSLEELCSMDLDNYILAATYDCTMNDYKKFIDIPLNDKYYNGGVLLINQKEWINEKCTERIINHLQNVRNGY